MGLLMLRGRVPWIVMVISRCNTVLSALQVLQENHRLEAKLGIMREQHALVAELLNTQLPAVDAEGDPKGVPLLAYTSHQ